MQLIEALMTHSAYFALSYFALSYFALSYFALSYFALIYFALSLPLSFTYFFVSSLSLSLDVLKSRMATEISSYSA